VNRITPAEFDFVRRLLYERAAIVLEPGKEYLAESRLLPLVRESGFRTLGELISRLRSEQSNGLHQKVVEAMTTNETSFFRDSHPFEALRRSVIPDLITKRAAERRLHIWCAACSTGQEPYCIAMLLREYFPGLSAWSLRLVASDISREILDRARSGCYSQLEVNRGLPASLLVKYFAREGTNWRIRADLRRMIDFREVNLAAPLPGLPPMDIVFLRNVLIYFDVETKKAILGKVRRLMRPDGYLFLGGAETTLNLDPAFERVPLEDSACYRLRCDPPWSPIRDR
jgi:chemotaxis protein methyltransferase CheR